MSAPQPVPERVRGRRRGRWLAGGLALFLAVSATPEAASSAGEAVGTGAEADAAAGAEDAAEGPRVVILTTDERNHAGALLGFADGYLRLRTGDEVRRFSPATVGGILPLGPGEEAPLPVDPGWRAARLAELVAEHARDSGGEADEAPPPPLRYDGERRPGAWRMDEDAGAMRGPRWRGPLAPREAPE